MTGVPISRVSLCLSDDSFVCSLDSVSIYHLINLKLSLLQKVIETKFTY